MWVNQLVDAPPDVQDVLLWRSAQDIASRHRPRLDDPGRCANPDCPDQGPYPCFARRLAEVGDRVSRSDWLPPSNRVQAAQPVRDVALNARRW